MLSRASRGEPARLPEDAKAAIADPETLVYVSAWEISIKRDLNRLDLRDEEFLYGMRESGLTELPVTAAHGLAAGALPAASPRPVRPHAGGPGGGRGHAAGDA